MTIVDKPDPWQSAQSLQDLAEATIDFLEGRLPETPSHGGPPDPESKDLIPFLVELNRAGFITTCSQPGLVKSPPRSMQRAYVEGFCDEETGAMIKKGVLFSELVMITFAPGCEGESNISVTIDEYEEFTSLGCWFIEELDRYRNGSEELNADLDKAWGVQIFDPIWGRNDRLWVELQRALRA